MTTRPMGRILAALGAIAACSCAGSAPPGSGAVPRPECVTPAAPPAVAKAAPAAPAAPPQEMFHAIFDAGSSGLRLQIFRVTRRPDGACAVGSAPPVFEAENNADGLADLTEPKDPQARALLLEFPRAEKVLADLWAQVPAETRPRITGVALLGTGGFRDVERIERGARLMMRKLEHVIEGWRTSPEQDWQALTIEGREEAVFAWLAARELGAVNHATIETGGQTCQYARSALDGWTADLGSNAVKPFMKEAPFAACTRETPDKPTSRADACIAAFGKRFAQSTIITAGAREFPIPRGGQLWAMGSAWRFMLTDYASTRRPPAPKPAVGTRLAIGDLYAFARQVCGPTPPTPEPEYEPKGWCMRASHAVAFAVTAHDGALLDSGSPAAVAGAVKAVAANEIILGKESFTRGAALSANLFKECRAGGAR